MFHHPLSWKIWKKCNHSSLHIMFVWQLELTWHCTPQHTLNNQKKHHATHTSVRVKPQPRLPPFPSRPTTVASILPCPRSPTSDPPAIDGAASINQALSWCSSPFLRIIARRPHFTSVTWFNSYNPSLPYRGVKWHSDRWPMWNDMKHLCDFGRSDSCSAL